jgi:hypothetical protein
MANQRREITRKVSRGVYKLGHAGKTYYRVGFSPQDSRARLARELKVKPESIEIMEGGKKQ